MTRSRFLGLFAALLAAPVAATAMATLESPANGGSVRGGAPNDVPVFLCGGYIMRKDALRKTGVDTLRRLNEPRRGGVFLAPGTYIAPGSHL